MQDREALDSIRLIVEKEREGNRLRIRLNRLRSWLKVVDRCVAAAEADTDADRLYQVWSEAVVGNVHFPAVTVVRIHLGQVFVVARAGVAAFGDVVKVDFETLVRQPWGFTIGADALPFGGEIRLRKAAWCCLHESDGHDVLLLAGYDHRSAQFVEDLDEDVVDHLRMTAQNLGALATRARATEALRREHEALRRLNSELQSRDGQLRSRNELLSHRTDELQAALGQLQRAQAELVHRERLGAVGQLAAGIAHEVNNPASFVLSNLEELAEWLGEEDSRSKPYGLAAEALEGLKHIVAIIRDLGMFSRAGDDQPQDLNVSELLGVVQRLTVSHAKHRAELRFSLGGDMMVRGSRRRLSQVLINLVMNALEAVPADRPVSQNHVSIRVREDQDAVRIEIADNGPGVPEHVRRHVFEPFYTTKSLHGGSGLGLSIVKDIVHEHGGEVWLDAPASEDGACFVIKLPRVHLPLRLLPQPTVSSSVPRVLLIDDDPRVVRAHERKLSERFTVVTAIGPKEGLRILEADAAIDAVLCDLMMPGCNGLELWRKVSNLRPRYTPRFIFLTGGIARADLRQEIEGGGFLVSPKPISMSEIERMVNLVVQMAADHGRADSTG